MAEGKKPVNLKVRGKLKAHFEERVLAAEKRMREDIYTFGGYDWFQLSAAEEEVFMAKIKRGRYARVLEAWKLSECLVDTVGPLHYGFDERLVMAERKNWPWLDFKHRRMTGEQFQQVARELCAVSLREADAIFAKMEFWQRRHEKYPDEEE